MAQVLTLTNNMPREEWLAWRRKGIGGSDAAAACGLCKYKSPIDLWLEKTGQLDPQEPSEAAYWGTLLEPLIRVEFTEQTNLQITRRNEILQHPKHPFMLANLDGIIDDPLHGKCIFEAKTTNAYNSTAWLEQIPEEYQLQVQHYLAVTGYAGAYVAVLIGGNKFRWHFIKRDDALIELLITLESRFWHYVESMTPPPIDGSEASTELLNKLFPHANQQQIILPDEAAKWISQYEEATATEKAAGESKNEAMNQLKALLGENESGVLGDRIIAWKSITSERLDSKALKLDHPEIYSNYSSPNSYRRFSISRRRNEHD